MKNKLTTVALLSMFLATSPMQAQQVNAANGLGDYDWFTGTQTSQPSTPVPTPTRAPAPTKAPIPTQAPAPQAPTQAAPGGFSQMQTGQPGDGIVDRSYQYDSVTWLQHMLEPGKVSQLGYFESPAPSIIKTYEGGPYYYMQSLYLRERPHESPEYKRHDLVSYHAPLYWETVLGTIRLDANLSLNKVIDLMVRDSVLSRGVYQEGFAEIDKDKQIMIMTGMTREQILPLVANEQGNIDIQKLSDFLADINANKIIEQATNFGGYVPQENERATV